MSPGQPGGGRGPGGTGEGARAGTVAGADKEGTGAKALKLFIVSFQKIFMIKSS